MGYRRDKQVALAWKQWRRTNDELMVATKLPSYITDQEDDWLYYLTDTLNVPGFDYETYPALTEEQLALKQLVFSYAGGMNTELGRAFERIEHGKVDETQC